MCKQRSRNTRLNWMRRLCKMGALAIDVQSVVTALPTGASVTLASSHCSAMSCKLSNCELSDGQHTLRRAADEKVQKSEQAGTFGQVPGGVRKIDSFPEDVSTIVVHHSSILRNKRLLLAYRSVY